MEQKFGMFIIQLKSIHHTYIILLANNFLEKKKEKRKKIMLIALGKISDHYDFLILLFAHMTRKG